MSTELTRIDQIKTGLVSVQKQITSLLQDEAKAKQFIAGALVVANSPALQKCTPDSIIQSLVGVAMADLNIDPAIGHCYLVPYWSKEGSKAQLQIGYKGFIQLLFRAGWLVKAFPVYTCDLFEISFNGWDNAVNFVPSIDERDDGDPEWCFSNMRGIYVVARHADTKDEYSTFVNKSQIEKLRLTSQNQKATQYTKPEDKKRLDAGLPVGIWSDWYVEMATGKAIKKLAKTLPIGDKRVATALIADEKENISFTATAETGIILDHKPRKPHTKEEKSAVIEKTIIESSAVEENNDETW